MAQQALLNPADPPLPGKDYQDSSRPISSVISLEQATYTVEKCRKIEQL